MFSSTVQLYLLLELIFITKHLIVYSMKWWKDSCPLKFHFIKRFSSMHFLPVCKTSIYIDWGTFQCIGIFQTSGFLSHSELSLYHLHTCIVIWKYWCVFKKINFYTVGVFPLVDPFSFSSWISFNFFLNFWVFINFPVFLLFLNNKLIELSMHLLILFYSQYFS